MRLEHLGLLVSPKTGKPLELKITSQVGDRVERGFLTDNQNNDWEIVNFIPRFVSRKNYGSSFGERGITPIAEACAFPIGIRGA